MIRSFTNKSQLIAFAALLALVASGEVFAQAATNTIPGIGGGVPPKVMIIFDTSNSMQHLPSTDLSTAASFPRLGDFSGDGGTCVSNCRNYDYRLDDYSPQDAGWDGGCDSRFCIAKRVLSNTLPTYADSIQMGMAGYYQFRTSYVPPNGGTTCTYDIMAQPGIDTTFPTSVNTWPTSGAGVRPPSNNNSSNCLDRPENRYLYSLTATAGGSAVDCIAYRPLPDAGPWTTSIDPQCSGAEPYALFGAPVEKYGSGSSQLTSNMFLRMSPTAVAADCTAGRVMFWRNTTGATQWQGGTQPSTPLVMTNTVLTKQNGANYDNFADPWISNCGTGLAACELDVQGDLLSGPTSETSLVSLWADAGTFTQSTVTFTYNDAPTTLVYQRELATASCTWPDGTVASVNQTKLLSAINAGDWTTGTGAVCSGQTAAGVTLNKGCRFTYRSVGNFTVPGAWSPAFPTGNTYLWSAPTSVTSVCSNPTVGSVTTPYTATVLTALMPFNKAPASCANTDTTSDTTLASNTSFSPSAPACTLGNPCEYRNGVGDGGVIVNPTVYYKAQDAGVQELMPGYPGTISVNRKRTFYGETCPTADQTVTFGTASCTAANPCKLNFLGVSDGGISPGNQTWYSSTPATYAVDGGAVVAGEPVYTFSSLAASFTPVPFADYAPEKTGATCAATATRTSGAVGAIACSAAHPCALTYDTVECRSIDTNAVVTCTTDTDSAQLRYCRYKTKLATFTATPYGTCNYSINTYKYQTRACRYQVNSWSVTAPACNEDRIRCNFDITENRYRYANPFKYCRVYGTEYTYRGFTPYTYTYKWTSKGGEYMGSFNLSNSVNGGGTELAQHNYCAAAVSPFTQATWRDQFDDAAERECPAQISAANNSAYNATVQGYCSAGRICKLRWRTTFDAGSPYGVITNGRMQFVDTAAAAGDPTFNTPDVTKVRCMTPDLNDGGLPTPNPDLFIPSSGTDWCTGSGTNNQPQVRLLSDWYEPTRPNSMSDLPFVDQWTNQPFKTSGWSSLSVDGGASQIFVPMDTGTNAMGSIQRALQTCVRPTFSVDAGGWTYPMQGGFCMSDVSNCGSGANNPCLPADAGMSDFTPLNGALANATDYMRTQLATDTGDWSCREYFVVLVTDGLESTPKNFTQGQIQSTVSSLTALASTTPARTKEVKTFVIGFGAGLVAPDGGANSLDAIAREGHTALVFNAGNLVYDFTNGRALNATNESELTNVLNIVFASITEGRFARSRPTLTTDGQRIYQAYFERGVSGALDAGSPEWRGNMIAYQIDSANSGALTAKWEFRDKLDDQADTSRALQVMVPGLDAGFTLANFSTSTASLIADAGNPFGVNGNAAIGTIRFVRNAGKGTGPDETFMPIATRRETRAGAFVFSSPVAVGKPIFSIEPNKYSGNGSEAAVASYANYVSAYANRQTRVLIGSEDGIFHGITDQTGAAGCSVSESAVGCPNGTEAWGVIPAAIVKNLPATRTGPQLLVDGTAAVSDVCWPTSGNNAGACGNGEWHTVAIGSLRAGGQSTAGGGTQKDSEYFALDITNPDAGFPRVMWRFNDRAGNTGPDYLGMTYSTPTMARVSYASGTSRWVALMGGGRCTTANGYGTGTDDEGQGIYMVDVETGVAQPKGSGIVSKWSVGDAGCINFVARPTAFRRTTTADTEAAYYGNEQGQLYAQRLWSTGASAANWAPKVFYDPWSTSAGFQDTQGNTPAPIKYMIKPDAADAGLPVGAAVDTACTMPLGSAGTPNALAGTSAAMPGNCSTLGATRRPIFGRPRIGFATDPSLTKPDLFFGTGDTQALDNTTARNFFFGIHDKNFTQDVFMTGAANCDPASNAGCNRGQTSWVYMFDPGEKVLGEPVIVSGAVVVATYKPPLGSFCSQLGDSYLYAYDPRTGNPKPALQDPYNPSAGFLPVVKLGGVGAISDPIVVNGGLYYADGRGSVTRVQTRPTGFGGRIQGWRRVR